MMRKHLWPLMYVKGNPDSSIVRCKKPCPLYPQKRQYFCLRQGPKPLFGWIVRQVLLPLNDLRDAFVIFGNSRHDRFGFRVLHLVSKSAYLFRSKSPEFWILQFGRGHRSTVTFLVAAPCRSYALIKTMRL